MRSSGLWIKPKSRPMSTSDEGFNNDLQEDDALTLGTQKELHLDSTIKSTRRRRSNIDDFMNSIVPASRSHHGRDKIRDGARRGDGSGSERHFAPSSSATAVAWHES